MVAQTLHSLVGPETPYDTAAKLRKAIAREQQEILDIGVLLARLDEEDALDRQEAVRKAPVSEITAGVGSGFEKRRRAREAAERKREFLLGNIEARTVALGESEQLIRLESRAQLSDRVSNAGGEVEEAWRDLASWCADGMTGAWPRLIAAFTAFNEVRESGWPGVMPESEAETWRANEAAHPTPVPLELLAAVEMIIDATCDPHGRGYIDGNSVRDGTERLAAILNTDLRAAASQMPEQRGGTEKRASSVQVLLGWKPDGSSNS